MDNNDLYLGLVLGIVLIVFIIWVSPINLTVSNSYVDELGDAICSSQSYGKMEFDKVEDNWGNITLVCKPIKPKPIEKKYEGIKINLN